MSIIAVWVPQICRIFIRGLTRITITYSFVFDSVTGGSSVRIFSCNNQNQKHGRYVRIYFAFILDWQNNSDVSGTICIANSVDLLACVGLESRDEFKKLVQWDETL